jgi:murein tripeptide amidase MpaA
MDAGTENGTVANMQKALRWFHNDAMSKEKSVIIGSSHTNQVGMHFMYLFDLNILFLSHSSFFYLNNFH